MKINQEHALEVSEDSGIKLVRDFPKDAAKRVRITPRVIVLHYSVTSNLAVLVQTMKSLGFFAHFAIDGYSKPGEHGEKLVTQMLPANVMGSHAGVSAYNGARGVNAFSIGIEIANPGPLLVKKGEGNDEKHLETTFGKPWPLEDAVKIKAPEGYPRNWNFWAKYSDEEIMIVIELCRALREKYPSIIDVVGHSTIAKGRKFDPGPAFPIDLVKESVFC